MGHVTSPEPQSELHLQTPRSAYVHVPFCAHRCGYCDFTLVAKRRDLIPKYLEAVRIGAGSDGWSRGD